MTPDINILIAAFRADHIHHQVASRWLNSAIKACSTGSSIEILPMVATGFLRLVTHKKIFSDPAPVKTAIAFMDALLAIPGVEMIQIGREWPMLCRLCQEEKLHDNDIPDAWIAAAVKANHSHLVTFDRGFSKLLNKGELTVLSVRVQS